MTENEKRQQAWRNSRDDWNLENLPPLFLEMVATGQLVQWDMNIRIFSVKGFEFGKLFLKKHVGLLHDVGTVIQDPTEFKRFIKVYKKLRDTALDFNLK